MSKNESDEIREKIANMLRGIETRSGSTVVACRFNFSRSNDSENEFNSRSQLDQKELQKIIFFYELLHKKLNECSKCISLINYSL